MNSSTNHPHRLEFVSFGGETAGGEPDVLTPLRARSLCTVQMGDLSLRISEAFMQPPGCQHAGAASSGAVDFSLGPACKVRMISDPPTISASAPV